MFSILQRTTLQSLVWSPGRVVIATQHTPAPVPSWTPNLSAQAQGSGHCPPLNRGGDSIAVTNGARRAVLVESGGASSCSEGVGRKSTWLGLHQKWSVALWIMSVPPGRGRKTVSDVWNSPIINVIRCSDEAMIPRVWKCSRKFSLRKHIVIPPFAGFGCSLSSCRLWIQVCVRLFPSDTFKD